jgi:DNA-binding HxlR family transcriptional regulator
LNSDSSNFKYCPIQNTFDLIGRKFTILILRDIMLYGKKHFNELLDSVEGINSKTLSLRIRELEWDGLIRRHIFHEMPLRVEYELTEKAMRLRPILEQMGEFSTRYCASDVFKDKKPRAFSDVLESQMQSR